MGDELSSMRKHVRARTHGGGPALVLLAVACSTAPVADAPIMHFASKVVEFHPGAQATFGQDAMPGVVMGPPQGAGADAGGLDVVSLGKDGTIVIALDAAGVVDGPGPDLLVFENPFPAWQEKGFVAVSEDGTEWHEWPCAPMDKAGGFPHCAGIRGVLSNAQNGVDPTDPLRAGGDAFDLADLGLKRAYFVRIRDAGVNPNDPPGAGFDLDAIAVVHPGP